jgi:co-chaperonin GroES (HSP10)
LSNKIENKSGIRPVGVSILVKPDPIEQTTASGIITSTHAQHEREEMGQTDGVVIAIGPNAYFDETPRCEVGDRVVMAKYAGMVRKGLDEATYRLIKDDDVKAILEKE